MVSSTFNKKNYSTEDEKTSDAFHNYDYFLNKLKSIRKKKLAIIVLFGIIVNFLVGLGEINWFLIVTLLILLPMLIFYFNFLKIDSLNYYFELHQNKLESIEAQYSEDILEPFILRYETQSLIEENIKDLVDYINHKSYIKIEERDIYIILHIHSIEKNIKKIEKVARKLNVRSVENFARILVVIFSEKNFENQENLEEVLDVFKEYQTRFDIDIDLNDLENQILQEFKERKINEFEQKLKRTSINVSFKDVLFMNGLEFEEFLCKLFEKDGYKVNKTKSSGDQGADLIIEKYHVKTAVQAKRYKGKVGNKAIQEVVASKRIYNCTKSMVVTTGDFTRSATDLAQSNNVDLINGEELRKLIDNIL